MLIEGGGALHLGEGRHEDITDVMIAEREVNRDTGVTERSNEFADDGVVGGGTDREGEVAVDDDRGGLLL